MNLRPDGAIHGLDGERPGLDGTILVTGRTGQLATALARAAPGRVRLAGRPALDFDRPETIEALFAGDPPATLVNAAAWTAVDAAEAEPASAARANAEAPAHLARLCARARHQADPYLDRLCVRRRQGRALCRGRRAKPDRRLRRDQARRRNRAFARRARTRSSCAPRGSMPRAGAISSAPCSRPGASGRSLRVVADQCGCPTNADDLARAVLAVAAQSGSGTFHTAGTGSATWHGFAEAIFAAAAPLGWPTPIVHAITTADYPTPARRPADSRLDCTRLAQTFGVALPDWQDQPAPRGRRDLRRNGGRVMSASPRRHPAVHLERRRLPLRPARQLPAPQRTRLAAVLARRWLGRSQRRYRARLRRGRGHRAADGPQRQSRPHRHNRELPQPAAPCAARQHRRLRRPGRCVAARKARPRRRGAGRRGRGHAGALLRAPVAGQRRPAPDPAVRARAPIRRAFPRR